MLTLPAAADLEQDHRAAYRPFRVWVAGIADLAPSFRRVTFASDDLRHFASHGLDQRVKLVLPVDGRIGDIGVDDDEALFEGSWYRLWRALPDAQRNPFRTYTVRGIRQHDGELDIDFVVHAHDEQGVGPAARWLSAAQLGDELVIVGPDARSRDSAIGMDWRPGAARELLLVGDETAAPAICGILESLAPGVHAHAFIEVPSAIDALPIASRANVSVRWLARDGGQSLERAVRDWTAGNDAYRSVLAEHRQELADIDVDAELLWDSPPVAPGTFYAWIAGESAMVKSLRRFLVSELGVDRARVAFMGYWRRGKSEAQG